MSIELTVYLQREAMPTPTEWATAIASAGFAAELATEFDVDDFSGFLPCSFEGAAAGFEYLSGPIEFVDGLELPDDFDFSVTLVTHSSLRDLASSTIAAAVLCQIADGILVDPQGDAAVSAQDAIAWAREQLADIPE